MAERKPAREAEHLNQPYETPNPDAPSVFQRDIYTSFSRPRYSTKPAEWESSARKKVPKANFGYVYGSAGTGKTNEANLAAFDRYRLRPSMLVNATRRDLGVELFGQKYSSPILVAPVGVQGIMHRDGEEATARACKNLGVPMILSTAATRSLEQVAKANGDGNRWYQLYWPKPQAEEVTASLLARAKTNGYTALVVTLDTFNIGWRPTDLDESYLPFLWGEGCQIGFSDPVFLQRFQEETANDKRPLSAKLADLWELLKRSGSVSGAAKILTSIPVLPRSKAWLDILNSATYREWSQLATLRKLWGDGPILLKGIQTVEDAHRAIDHGIDGIIVSNHGGRQLDGATASLDALADIAADEKVKKSGITILFDSGIRTGSDVLKALCLGAKAVLIGRPYMYGLAMGGQDGVEHVLKCILADTDNSLGNLGKKSLKDLSRYDLQIRRDAKL